MIGSALPNQNVRLGSVADFKALHDFATAGDKPFWAS
jgi:hypothetical protein